ncbi:MAG: hypothetical protein HYS32_01155 [Candidatus Woesearchaeota archaeon]|nr:MAG: hypothetical protein HYS32_01155 [Candidatus Woesearchaeota archaeon]
MTTMSEAPITRLTERKSFVLIARNGQDSLLDKLENPLREHDFLVDSQPKNEIVPTIQSHASLDYIVVMEVKDDYDLRTAQDLKRRVPFTPLVVFCPESMAARVTGIGTSVYIPVRKSVWTGAEKISVREVIDQLDRIRKAQQKGLNISIVGLGNLGGEIVDLLIEDLTKIEGGYIPFVRTISITSKESFGSFATDRVNPIEQDAVRRRIITKDDVRELPLSDVIIIAARNRGYNPATLVKEHGVNARRKAFDYDRGVIEDIGEKLRERGEKEGELVIVSTNPVNVMSELLHRCSGISRDKILANTSVDTIRFRRILAEEATKLLRPEETITADGIQGIVVGDHGPTMVPVYSYSTVGEVPLLEIEELKPRRVRGDITKRTRYEGDRVTEGRGSTRYEPASALRQFLRSLSEGEQTMPMGIYSEELSRTLGGPRGFTPVFLGMPPRIVDGRIVGITPLHLIKQEKRDLARSYREVRKTTDSLLESKAN